MQPLRTHLHSRFIGEARIDLQRGPRLCVKDSLIKFVAGRSGAYRIIQGREYQGGVAEEKGGLNPLDPRLEFVLDSKVSHALQLYYSIQVHAWFANPMSDL